MAQELVVNGKTIRPGHDAAVRIFIARLPTHTVIELPVHIFRGEEDGPVLLLSAGLHGDEINGIEIVRRMIREQLIKPRAGTVIALPIINVFGFIHFSRELPDGKDMNRSFPGSQGGSLARRNAYILMNEILPAVDYGVDFHTGGASRTNYPQVRCVLSDEKNLELAHALAPPFIINARLIDKSFRQAAYKRGKYIVVYEGGESLRYDEFAIREGVDCVIRLMNYLGMTDQVRPSRKSILIQRSRWIRARSAGVFRSLVELGTQVVENQVLGTLSDPFGGRETIVKSPGKGHVIGLNNIPVVNRGEALFHIGTPAARKGPKR